MVHIKKTNKKPPKPKSHLSKNEFKQKPLCTPNWGREILTPKMRHLHSLRMSTFNFLVYYRWKNMVVQVNILFDYEIQIFHVISSFRILWDCIKIEKGRNTKEQYRNTVNRTTPLKMQPLFLSGNHGLSFLLYALFLWSCDYCSIEIGADVRKFTPTKSKLSKTKFKI